MLLWLLLSCASMAFSQNLTFTQNATMMVEEASDYGHPEVIVEAAEYPMSNTKPSQDNKNLALPFMDRLAWLNPIADKFAGILAVANHPNFGGFQFLSPQHLWEKVQDKVGQGYLTGPYGAIFGIAHHDQKPPSDYPFAYRNNRQGKATTVVT